MYTHIFNIINDFVYNGSAVVGSVHYDIASLLSTVACVTVLVIPFWVILSIIKRLL